MGLRLLALCAALTVPFSLAWAQGASFPMQLEMRAPFAPTTFASGDQNHLFYELYLTNFQNSALDVQRIEILDATRPSGPPISVIEGAQLEAVLRPAAGRQENKRLVANGATTIAFIEVFLPSQTPVPERLVHRVLFSSSQAMGANIGTHATKLRVLSPPLKGSHWLAADGPGNGPDNHHRRGIFIVDGQAGISRRFATDWKGDETTGTAQSDPQLLTSYYAYGKKVLAVADAGVVAVTDGIPENVPGHGAAFRPAAPITMSTVYGNTVTLDLGDGQYAHYLHLQNGSVGVKIGDRVRRGQIIGRVGCSGDAREPHLHFEVTNSPKALAGEGLPFVIDAYRVKAGGASVTRRRSLPLNNEIIDFGDISTKKGAGSMSRPHVGHPEDR